MKSAAPFRRGFTLIELLTVMAVIAILAGLATAVIAYVGNQAGRRRANGEIAMLSAAIENYEADNGSVPRHTKNDPPFDQALEVTDGLDPRKDGDPTKGKYQRSTLFLYTELAGDKLPSPDKPDGQPDQKKSWLPESFPQGMLDRNKERTEVKFLKDPFGHSYGYSTAALRQKIKLQKEGAQDPKHQRTEEPKGYNGASFDLWSTGGTRQFDDSAQWISHEKWLDNW